MDQQSVHFPCAGPNRQFMFKRRSLIPIARVPESALTATVTSETNGAWIDVIVARASYRVSTTLGVLVRWRVAIGVSMMPS
jgi:hypothetical protein